MKIGFSLKTPRNQFILGILIIIIISVIMIISSADCACLRTESFEVANEGTDESNLTAQKIYDQIKSSVDKQYDYSQFKTFLKIKLSPTVVDRLFPDDDYSKFTDFQNKYNTGLELSYIIQELAL
jgi:hypothetical protein